MASSLTVVKKDHYKRKYQFDAMKKEHLDGVTAATTRCTSSPLLLITSKSKDVMPLTLAISTPLWESASIQFQVWSSETALKMRSQRQISNRTLGYN